MPSPSASAASKAVAATAPSSRPSKHLEIETKLTVEASAALPDPLQHKAVRKSGLTAVTPEVVHELDATYFDTDHLDLLRSKVTLRRRTGGDDAGWHLKLPSDPTDAATPIVKGRTEVQLPLGAGDGTGAVTVPRALAVLVRGTARDGRLHPVARLQNRRTVVRLLNAAGEPAVEIADDHVTATRPDGGAEPQRWREVEVELLGGTVEQLAATVKALLDGGARPADAPSKLARALPLPAAPTPPGKPKSAGTAVLAALTRLRDRLIACDRLLREHDEPSADALYAARATVRRIRSVLSTFRGLFSGDSTEQLSEVLREFARTMGAARDLHVVRIRLDQAMADEPAEFSGGARSLIELELGRRLRQANTAVRQYLDGAEYFAMLRRLDALIAEPELTARAGRGAATELPLQLAKVWRELKSRADDSLSDPDNTEAAHAVRRTAKTLRYATEAGIAVLGDDAVVFAAGLEQVQEVLGEHQDAQVTAAVLVELAADPMTDGPAGFTLGRVHAVEQAVAAGAMDEFTDAWDAMQDTELAGQLG